MAKRITSPEDLKRLRDEARTAIGLRSGESDMQIVVHMGTCGIAAGARDILSQLAEELGDAGITHVALRQSGCLGLCDQEPMMTLSDRDGKEFRYGRLDRRKVHEIVREHVVQGRPVLEHIVAS